MITWIKFKYEHVIDTCFPPAVRVKSQKKRDQHKKENTTVNTNSDIKLATVICKESWKIKQSNRP